jgi:alpha-amylase
VGSTGLVTVSIPGNGGTGTPAVALHVNQKVSGGTTTPPPTCTTVAVTFRVANANTTFGQNVHVTGNRNELGNWTATTSNQLVIQGSGANVPWQRTFQLPPSTAIQYKFLKYGGGATVWERNQATASGNRQATTPVCGQTMLLDAGSFAF